MLSQKKSVPFPNIYKLRKLAQSDAKSCFICYKPTVSVLVTLKSLNYSELDFFYICESHLLDKNFCSSRFLSDDIDNLEENKEIELKIENLKLEKLKLSEKCIKLEKLVNDENGIGINKIVGYFNKKEKGKNLKPEPDGDGNTDGDTEVKDKDKSKPTLDNKEKLNSIKKEIELKTLELQKLEIKYKKFQLDMNYYQLRLKKYNEILKKKEHAKKLQDPSFFPSVKDLPKPGEQVLILKNNDDENDI
ncbi:hypothetical protein PACTADRAFT_35468 [Pachysolen tannophilus NRRL Y-2460]|uniref:DUF1742-domain-containing protein n=1 Tax=Pachysolen tannophilus NRRL Y-2460 TaxID=669874 RepID=A0A1E4TPP6_PACTA|nr:hypothetical protein PACTADRAFT_35468 [Pachysolen tannophilus NRRL Y-2460]